MNFNSFLKQFLFNSLIILLLIKCLVECEETADKESDKKIKKLQIGVKKRVENCDRKSSKGDILHIHYRVSHCHKLINWLVCYLMFLSTILGHTLWNGRWIRQFLQKRTAVDIHIRYGSSDSRLGSGIVGYVCRWETQISHTLWFGLWFCRCAADYTSRRGPHIRSRMR